MEYVLNTREAQKWEDADSDRGRRKNQSPFTTVTSDRLHGLAFSPIVNHGYSFRGYTPIACRLFYRQHESNGVGYSGAIAALEPTHRNIEDLPER